MKTSMRILAGVALLVALGVIAHPAHAATSLTITVTTPLDGDDPTPADAICETSATSAAAGRCSLRAAVETASAQGIGVNTTINVPSASQHYLLTGNGPLRVSKLTPGTITIVGAQREGVIIDGSPQTNGGDIVVDSDAVIRNLTITGGTNTSGAGGVNLAGGNLLMSNVRITNNSGLDGGGVYQQGTGTMTITNAEIDNNGAYGGTYYNPEQGGGLDLAGGNATYLSYDVIIDNSTTGYGGGMYIDNALGAVVHASHLLVAGNRSYKDGGGINAQSGSYADPTTPQVILDNSVVENNVASQPGGDANTGGGGIENSTALEITDTQITHNTAGILADSAGVGGGIDNYDDLIMSGGSISNNTAGNDSGGMSNFSTASLTNVAVTGNRTGVSACVECGGGYGGGIFTAGFSTLKMVGGTISGNTAGTDGGGITIQTQDVELDRVGITGNVAGGPQSCYAFGGGLVMDPYYFTPVTVSNPGVHSSRINNNTSEDATVTNTWPSACGGSPPPCGAQGGGIYLANTALTVDGATTVSGNHSCSGGGFYITNGADLNFSGTAALDVASEQGGAMYVDSSIGGATVTGSAITGNLAKQQTGGIYNLAPVTISNSVVSSNVSPPPCPNLLNPCR